MIISIKTQGENVLKRFNNQFSKKQVLAATSEAINKTLLLGRTVARREVKNVFNIPQKNLSVVNVKRSTIKTLTGAVGASSKFIPMDAFSPRFVSRSADGNINRLSVTRRGVLKNKAIKKNRQGNGVSIEIYKGKRSKVPYAFMIKNARPRVFARGEYNRGNGSYGFVRRHRRLSNSTGNDSVKPLVSITVYGAIINKVVRKKISQRMEQGYANNLFHALNRQLDKATR